MDDLVQWLRTQLDEDERIARGACEGAKGEWRQVNPERFPGLVTGDHNGGAEVCFDEGYPTGEQAAHIAEWDPARVLRETEAKRRIVEIHQVVGGFEDEDMTDLGSGCSECGYSAEYGDRGGWCETLRLLALPYEDRPGYQEEWRP